MPLACISTGTVVALDIALILLVLALLTGLVDTIAGGGGPISVPALLRVANGFRLHWQNRWHQRFG